MFRDDRQKEEYVIALDFLPHGYPFDNQPGYKKTPIVQAIGKVNFILLELVPKKEIFIQPLEEIYIGDGKRDKIHHINGRLDVIKLTTTAKSQLKFVVEDLINKDEDRFINFFNEAQPLTTRMHQLELLPGLGKKHMWEILDERKVNHFKNFADLKKRIRLLPDPKKALVRRIIDELSGKEKHKVFIA